MKGLITEDEVKALKEAYPKLSLYKWTDEYDTHQFVYRTLNQMDIAFINDKVQASIKEDRPVAIDTINEIVFERCIVWPILQPQERVQMPVGWIPSLVKSIQEKSGYVDVDVANRVIGPDLRSRVLKDFDYWPDLPKEEEEGLKKDFVLPLHKVTIDGKWFFVIRPMTKLDLHIAGAAEDEELALVKQVVMWPKTVDWNLIPTGIIDQLGRQANKISGWVEPGSVKVEEL